MFSPCPSSPITPDNLQIADHKTRAEVAREWWARCTSESKARLLCDENSLVRNEAIYSKRRAQVAELVSRARITVEDLQTLDRLGRFTVSAEHWDLCDDIARKALLADAHPHVRSAALLSSTRNSNPN